MASCEPTLFSELLDTGLDSFKTCCLCLLHPISQAACPAGMKTEEWWVWSQWVVTCHAGREVWLDGPQGCSRRMWVTWRSHPVLTWSKHGAVSKRWAGQSTRKSLRLHRGAADVGKRGFSGFWQCKGVAKLQMGFPVLQAVLLLQQK